MTTSRSKFTLCPRGYGKNSFRMYECMQLGSIPIYIYDDDWRPFKDILNWDDFSISIHYNQLDTLKSKLESLTEDNIKLMSENCIKVYDSFFSLESVCKIITSSI